MAYIPPNPNGSATSANSAPVVIASDQSNVPVNQTQVAGTTVDTNSGNKSAGTQRIIIATDQPQLTNALKVDGSAVTQPVSLANETTKVIGTVNQGTSPWVVSGTITAGVADIAPATQNITVIDSGSSTATGANNQSIVIGTPTAGSAASFTLSTIETVRVEVTGIWTGTLIAETSIDGGTTWTAQGLHQGAYTTSTFTAGFIGGANVAGATNFRMRATAAMTGTAVVKVIESVNTQSVYIANAAPSGTVASVLNSSTATLGISGVYTGTGEDVLNFSEMRVSVISNVASATDGFSIQQSSNNVNWDIVDNYTVSANEAKTIVVPRQARYFRVVYTNGGTGQGSFRLQSILNRTATAPSSQRPSDAYSNEVDLVQSQVFNMVYNGTTHDRMRGDITNGVDVDVTRMSALVAGSAVVGKVGIDQTTPGTTNLVALAANQSVNVAQMNGVATTMGNGVAGTGVQRVAIASDNTAFSVNATLSAETTKVIGTVNQGTSPWITSNATTSVVGNGASATAQRVTLANDSTGVIATVSAVTAITNALPTGTNSIGKISDITTSIVPGTGATNLGKAEDAVHATGDTGVFTLGVANTGAGTAFAASGDYTPFSVDLNGVTFTRSAPANTGTLANVAGATSSTTLIAANTSRRTVIIYNDSTSDLYIKYGSAASSTSFTYYLPSLGTLSFDGSEYAGIVTGIWISATGNARVTETT